MSVAADQAQANGQSTAVNFENSHWVFKGNVKIATEQGQLSADEATSPSSRICSKRRSSRASRRTFEQHNPDNGKPAHGNADLINYDVAQGHGAAVGDTPGSRTVHDEIRARIAQIQPARKET